MAAYWPHKVVNANRIRAVGEEAVAGTTLILGIGQPDPEKDAATLNGLVEVGCMSGNEPKAQGILQAWRA
jgi:hypothetical protein